MEWLKCGKIIGSATAFAGSTIAFVGSAALMPPLIIPVGLITLYTSQKLLNNTLYKSYKDLAFIVRKSGKNQKIFQDVMRPDLLKKLWD